jgi:amino acid adenylation domain-containing protein
MLTDSQRTALAARLRSLGGSTAGRIRRRPADLAQLPTSFGQEQLWFLDRLHPGQSTYHVPVAVRAAGALDASALSRAVDALLARHEVLRTRLVAGEQGRPVQRIDPPPTGVTALLDYSEAGRGEALRLLGSLAATELQRPFALADGPLLRAHLVRLSPDEHVLLFMIHHAVFDGWSCGILLSDLARLYEAEVTGEPADMAELPIQFADYALWERDCLTGAPLEQLQEYWREVLAGFGTVQLPADRPRPVVDGVDGDLAGRLTEPGLLDGLRELSRREGTTLFVTVMAALQALIYRYTGQADFVVGTVSADRSRSGLAPLIGYLVNTLPIRADLSGDPAFTDLLARVRDRVLGAYDHQRLPFGQLVDTLQVPRDASRAPVFQIMLSYGQQEPALEHAPGVQLELIDPPVAGTAAKFDLDFLAEARSDGLWLECSYKTALFDATTIERLLGHLEVLLRGILADPAARLSALPVLTESELRRELDEWNDAAGGVPASCAHAIFEEQAARTPEAVAAELGQERISYAGLNRQANQIARRLRGAGVGPEVLVGICLSSSLRRLAALLGVWKAGGGYVPLDPALPADRLSFMMRDTGMTVVLADAESAASLPQTGPAVIALDACWQAISELDDQNLAQQGARPANVAYVIYTSGSTGLPKGVVIEHRQLVSFQHAMITHWRIGPSDVVLQFASLSFDASVHEMFMPLLAGGRVVLVPAQTRQSARRLAALMRDAQVSFACLTPSVASLLADEQFPDLRVLMCGGEELPAELARRWIRPGLRFVNDYGPTETTISATFMELDAGTELPPPIGRPLRTYQAYVLDAHLNPVPAGAVGELHIGGAGVARGYLNRPELTQERFIPDPFRAEPGARLYKTGDLARRRPDGSIVFAGRADGQVKIRGLRIELGEIETALAAHPAVAQAVVAVTSGPAGDRQLTGYLRAEPGTEPTHADLRAHLARTLPGYMIPAHLIAVREFPLNSSGKIDRQALPAPDAKAAQAESTPPATFTEAALTRIYAAVLVRDTVSSTDSFFDIGGSSLQAMRLIDRISSELGVDVGVATIFLHPAPRQLAASIDSIRNGTPGAAGSGQLVELSPGPGRLPLFLIHAVGGTVFAYAQLVRELAGTFRVYGLEAPGLSQAGATGATLSDLVRDYSARIRAVQPDGPYRLAGWSMGGVIAFEIARQLESEGAEVNMLTLLDAPFAVGASAAAESQLAGQFLTDAVQSMGFDQSQAPDPATSTAADQLSWLAGQLGADHPDSGLESALRQRFDVFRAHVLMLAGYQPTAPQVSAATLIVSADSSPNAPARDHWLVVLSGPCNIRGVPGDHYTFLRQPHVTEVATAILQWHAAQAGSVSDAREAPVSTDMAIEPAAREELGRVLDCGIEPADLDPDLDLAESYGLTSLNKVLFLMSVCDSTGVSLSSFTEADVASMRTLADVVAALAKYAATAA